MKGPFILLIKADITQLDTDAIVNAANSTLLGGGGDDGAIHRAAGPGLLAECRGLGGCPTGEARITKGHGLRAHYVIHTVGPVWSGGNCGEAIKLAGCYRNSMLLAEKNQCSSIAFPNVSTGIYGFPKQEASGIALRSVRETLKLTPGFVQVVFCCFDNENYELYSKLLSND